MAGSGRLIAFSLLSHLYPWVPLMIGWEGEVHSWVGIEPHILPGLYPVRPTVERPTSLPLQTNHLISEEAFIISRRPLNTRFPLSMSDNANSAPKDASCD